MPNLSEALQKQLAAWAPEGYDPANVRLVVASGTCEPLEELSVEETAVIAAVAQGPKRITDGKPTVMRVYAWMVHEGVNRNGDGFVKEELQLCADKISTTHPLVMDWNHAAVVGGEGKVIGVWTRATYAFDQKADNGKGKWGLLVEGVMFAWLYPELADVMLADQARNGTINFSMACLAESVEFGTVDGRRVSWLHNPVFFTNSALDVPPGDPDAIGVGQEGAVDAEKLRAQIANTTIASAALDQVARQFAAAILELLKQGAHAMPKTPEEIAADQALADAAQAEADRLAAEAAAEAAAAAELVAKATELEAKLAEASVHATELETANAALQTENERLSAEVTALQAQLEAITVELAEAKSAQAAADAAATLASRIEALPDTYLAAHRALAAEKQAEVEASWAAMSDEAWTAKLADLHMASPSKTRIAGFLERSKALGRLPVGGAATEQSIPSRIHKFTRA